MLIVHKSTHVTGVCASITAWHAVRQAEQMNGDVHVSTVWHAKVQ